MCRTLAAAEGIADFDAGRATLAAAFWPGPLTLVLQRRRAARHLAARQRRPRHRGGARPARIRSPRRCCAPSGRPLAAPSANPSGRVSPTTAAACRRRTRQPGRVDPRRRRLPGGHRVDGGRPEPARARCCCAPAASRGSSSKTCSARSQAAAPTPSAPRSPGQLDSHYAPRLPLRLERGDARPR